MNPAPRYKMNRANVRRKPHRTPFTTRKHPWRVYVLDAMGKALPRQLTALMIAEAASRLAGYPKSHPDRLRQHNCSLLSRLARRSSVRRLKQKVRNSTKHLAQRWRLAKPSINERELAEDKKTAIQLAHALQKYQPAGRIALRKKFLAQILETE